MSIRPGAPGLKRHWFVAISAVVCFVTSLALLFSAFYRPTTVDFKEPIQWVYTWMWSLLELFPNPATLGAMVAFFRPWRELQHTHAAVALASNALLFLFSLALGWSLWQRHSWA